jgi:uncharacterized Fe-S cluster-containing radical SAM superfamily protein
VSTNKPIETVAFSERLRDRAIDVPGRRLLVTRLAGSAQERDLTVPTNCDGFGRIRHFRTATSPGWPANPLPIVPACKALGLSPPPAMMTAQVFQNAACNWRCWYCYVPYGLLSANPKHSAWYTPDALVGLYLGTPDRPPILDLSGGSPDLVPEWVPWTMDALSAAGFDRSTYLWSDDNLSTTYFFERLTPEQIRLVQTYPNYGRVCCFKGFDAHSFAFNTRAAEADFDRQFDIMARLLALGIDLYGYVTLTTPCPNGIRRGVRQFMDRLQSLDPNLPLRVVPLEIRVFSPVEQRLDDTRRLSLALQEEAVAAWTEEIKDRFDTSLRNANIADVILRTRRYGTR